MEVYVKSDKDPSLKGYTLVCAKTNNLLADFDTIREVDAYVTANGFTYVAAPDDTLIEDSKRLVDMDYSKYEEVAVWYAEAVQQATLSALLPPEEYSQYLTNLGIEGKGL